MKERITEGILVAIEKEKNCANLRTRKKKDMTKKGKKDEGM